MSLDKPKTRRRPDSTAGQEEEGRRPIFCFNLEILVKSGAIRPGEIVELRIVEGCEATVTGKGLVHNGKVYSMSDLAQRLLTRHGYKKTAVRGPAHWFTKQGRSIKDLWGELNQQLD